MSSCQNRERVPEADVLRAICCIIVVLLHAFIGAEIHPGLDRTYESRTWEEAKDKHQRVVEKVQRTLPRKDDLQAPTTE